MCSSDLEEKSELMRKLGSKQLTLQLEKRLERIPDALAGYALELSAGGTELIHSYDVRAESVDVAALMRDLDAAGIRFRDLHTTQSSLEDIFVDLVSVRR